MKQNLSESPERLAENWQRCRQEDLPKAFYAYDETEQQSERVVTYRLKGKETIKSLLDLVGKKKKFNFIVRLGLRTERMTDEIFTEPAFALFIQVHNLGAKNEDLETNGFELAWERNSRFSVTQESNANSEANAIPAAGAYLFIHAWLETPESHLAVPFTAATRVMGERVKSYIFSQSESLSIYNDLKNSKENCLDIHLGRGLAVWVHPFSFRPVIEVKGAVAKGKTRQVPMNATGLTNEDGDSYYDYGFPDPPGDPD